jgi:hypothetical protein
VEVWLTDEALEQGEKAVRVCRELNCTDRELALNVFIAMSMMQKKMQLAPPASEVLQ